MKKEDILKDQFKQALISTIKVISEEYKTDISLKKNLSSNNYNFFELDNLNNKQDYIKIRAQTDSEALKRKFSNKEIYQKNIPKNQVCKSLYDIAEKIRYETLGSKMLKGISKNLKENYNYLLSIKRKDQLKTKDDVSISEAFELYMLKNFFDVKLNTLSEKILSFWENDFKSSLDKHLDFLKNNLENQEIYNSKFSELIQKMKILDSDNDKDNNDKSKNENEEDNNPKKDANNQPDSKEENSEIKEDQKGMDAEYDLSEHEINEQLVDTDSEDQVLKI